jgi:ATP-dependent Clp protease ATP-binding subunit ClpC
VFERFTRRARQVVVEAQEELRLLGHDRLGTEHLLLGLLRVEDGLAARALAELGVDLAGTRAAVERAAGRGEAPSAGQVPFTPRAKKALDVALREALRLGHDYIGTEHILLGIVREGEGVAAGILREQGATAERVEQAVVGLLAGWTPPGSALTGSGLTGSALRGSGLAGPPWPRRAARPRRPPTYEVRLLEGAPSTWTEQLNGWAAEGWSLHTVVQQDGETAAVLFRRG